MSYSNGTIYEPVSIYDVQRALSTNENDVGRLCVHTSINKWARYKPIRYYGFPIRFHTTDSVFTATTGLSVSSSIDTPSRVAGYSSMAISYERPYGGMNSPYRLTDFVKYYHYAQRPCEIVWQTIWKKDRAYGCYVRIYDGLNQDNIRFSDIMNELQYSSGFSSLNKRLCLAVFDESANDQAPFYYFFSDIFSFVGSNGSWDVYCNMYNTDFVNRLTVGHTYKFLVMVVSDHSYLNQIVSGDTYRWQIGVTASEMSSMESGSNPIQAMPLGFDAGMDRYRVQLQQASVITDMSYFLEILRIDHEGNDTVRGNYTIHCAQITPPNIIVRIPQNTAMDAAGRYQLRVLYSSSTASPSNIFRPTSRNGDNYYEIESTPSSSLGGEINLTPWVSYGDIENAGGYYTEPDPQDSSKIIKVYEFDFYNFQNTILSQSEPQTLGKSSGIYMFWDLDGNIIQVSFKLYYKATASAQEILVKNNTMTVNYNAVTGEGYIHDITL